MQEVIDRSNLELISKNFFGSAPFEITKLKGDGSERRIYRIIHRNDSIIGVCGNNRAENDAFVGFTEHFAKHKLNVPEMYLYESAKGIYLLQDLGDVTLAEYKKELGIGLEYEHIVKCYERVIDHLIEFQITAGKTINFNLCYQHQNFDENAIRWDLLYFKNRYLSSLYKQQLDSDSLDKDLRLLAQWLSGCNSDFFMYRDFQARNIMMFKNDFYFIDYQSGRRGASQYDLASLLIDAKNGLEEKKREYFLDYYVYKSQNKIHVNINEFKDYFYGFALARILQALGAFGFLSKVKDQKQYESFIPVALNNMLLIIKHIPILVKLKTLNSTLISLLNQVNSE